jgi:hypothetical protein
MASPILSVFLVCFIALFLPNIRASASVEETLSTLVQTVGYINTQLTEKDQAIHALQVSHHHNNIIPSNIQ